MASPANAELAAVLLFESGAQAVGEVEVDGYVSLTAGFPDLHSVAVGAEAITGLAWSISIQEVEPDWVEQQRSGLSPTTAGRWSVRAPWHEPQALPAVDVIIEPGASFGHGGHPTTTLMLELLDPMYLDGLSVCDVGTGSGVLAIAAALVGAEVTAIDNDPAAIEAATANVATNDVTNRVTIALAEGADVLPSAELALINVTIDQHRAIAARVRGFTTILVSGILEHQRDEAVELYRPWIPAEERRHDGWIALHLIQETES